MRYRTGMWAWIGAALSALGALLAMRQARTPERSGFAHEEYGMTARSHRRFSVLSAGFCCVFVAGAIVRWVPVVAVLALYVLALVLYAASFARGFSDG